MLPTAHCLVSTHAEAEKILQLLHGAGISQKDIAYVHYSSSDETAKSPAKEIESNKDAPSEKTVGGTAAGAAAGAAAGVGIMSIVGLTPLLMIAPAVVTAGAAIGAGAGTSIALSALDDYGVPEAEHAEYERKLRAGGALIAVQTKDENELENARTTMEQVSDHVRVIRLTKKLD